VVPRVVRLEHRHPVNVLHRRQVPVDQHRERVGAARDFHERELLLHVLEDLVDELLARQCGHIPQ